MFGEIIRCHQEAVAGFTSPRNAIPARTRVFTDQCLKIQLCHTIQSLFRDKKANGAPTVRSRHPDQRQ